MSWSAKFGSKDAADSAREDYSEHVCSVDDDKRHRTVWFASDTPDAVRDAIENDAMDSRGDGADGPGQAPLTDAEKDRIDFSKRRANIPHARSVKAIAGSKGVSDWTAYYDHTLTVDEHREVMDDAAREGGGKRREDSEDVDAKAGRAARRAKGEGCDHAKGHCENGDTDACEHLKQVCDYSESEVNRILSVDDRTDAYAESSTQIRLEYQGEEISVTPEQAGALQRSWGGYKTALGRLSDALDDVRETVPQARQAFRAINSIREANGQEPMHPNRLHEILESLEGMPEEIPEVRTLEHFRDSNGDGADVEQADADDSQPDQFAQEKQGTLGVDVEAEDVAEEKQVTLTGEDQSDSTGSLPSAWRRDGDTWNGGRYSVQMDGDRHSWDVKLFGPADSFTIADRLDGPVQAEDVAVGFTDRVAPDEVSMKSSDGTIQEAAAAAKRDAIDDEGGLLEYQ